VTATDGTPRCTPDLVRQPEEAAGLDRTFTVAVPASYDLGITVTPRAGTALDRLIQHAARGSGAAVTASSSAVPDPRSGPDAAIDGDPATTWVASGLDPHPAVTVTWDRPRTVYSVRAALTAGAPASRPLAVTVSAGGATQTVQLGADGRARLAPVTARSITVGFPSVAPVSSYDPYTRQRVRLGVGISELELAGTSDAGPDTPVDLACGQGPSVELDGATRRTALHTTLGALRSLQPVRLEPCGDTQALQLPAGQHRLVVTNTDAFAATSATLTRTGDDPGSGGTRAPARVTRWGAEHRTLRVAARDVATLLVVPDNVNAGWRATLDGAVLRTVTVDGWQQGYVLAAGTTGTVHLDYAPGATYRAALLGGAAALLVLLGVALLGVRRPGSPPVGRGRGSRLLVPLALVVATALIGGVVGLVLLGSFAVVARVGGRWRTAVLATTAGVSLAAATVVHLRYPWSVAGTADQVLVLAAVLAVAVLAGAAEWRGRRSGTSPRKPLSGCSTRA
jgi:arabinofuranan 3-O-arabinosyltransferase